MYFGYDRGGNYGNQGMNCGRLCFSEMEAPIFIWSHTFFLQCGADTPPVGMGFTSALINRL